MQPLHGKDYLKIAVIVGVIVGPIIFGLSIWKYLKLWLQS